MYGIGYHSRTVAQYACGKLEYQQQQIHHAARQCDAVNPSLSFFIVVHCFLVTSYELLATGYN